MAQDPYRLAALRDGVRVEALSVAWMALEAAIAIGAGILARSVLLTTFGLDSVIELISGGLLIWRLGAEARASDIPRMEAVERRASWIAALLLLVLCGYVLATSIAGLLTHLAPEPSWPGLGIAAAAVILMPLLAWRKRRLNVVIGSPALRADVSETITCAAMALITLVGVALGSWGGWWWAEYVAALVLLLFIGHEAGEAIAEARAG
jgi:divalent metal cation (Fe/Co/Zn/Cd) transporter